MTSFAADRPNIIVIHTHDTGRYFGCYGYDVSTPNINRLASEGMQFDNYFCPSPQCSPSRASSLTGLYPHNNGMLGLSHLGWQLRDNVQTLPSLLTDTGYETFLFGVQHEGRSGQELGYAHSHVTKMPQRAQIVSKEFSSFLKEQGRQPRQPPFFASVGFWETHRPFTDPEYSPSALDSVTVPSFLPDTPEVRQDMAEFEGTLAAADKGVGVILEALDESGLADNTLLAVTVDHGIAFPRAKGTLYDAGLGVALIVRWDNHIARGTVCSELLCNVDFAPTILDVAGLQAPSDIDGTSFLPLLTGNTSPSPRESFFCELTWHDRYSPQRGIRTNGWKYIRHFEDGPAIYLPLDIHQSISGQAVRNDYYAKPNVQEELYNLDVDPQETNNLADSADHTEVLVDLRHRVQEWMESTNDPLLRGPIQGAEAPGWETERSLGRFPF